MTAPFKILVAEDSEEDRLLMTHSLSRIPGFQLVGELEHDQEVRAYLQGKGIYADRHLYPPAGPAPARRHDAWRKCHRETPAKYSPTYLVQVSTLRINALNAEVESLDVD
jgi:hypothetical protein